MNPNVLIAQRIIEVVQAHRDGAKIEQRDKDHPELGWRECPFPNWDFYRVDFRVAQPRQPLDFWITPVKYGLCWVSETETEGALWHTREVIE